jgi:hypothetical protein
MLKRFALHFADDATEQPVEATEEAPIPGELVDEPVREEEQL